MLRETCFSCYNHVHQSILLLFLAQLVALKAFLFAKDNITPARPGPRALPILSALFAVVYLFFLVSTEKW